MTANHPRHSGSTSATASSNVVGVHYRVGRKIGEGSFGIIYEGGQLIPANSYYYYYSEG